MSDWNWGGSFRENVIRDILPATYALDIVFCFRLQFPIMTTEAKRSFNLSCLFICELILLSVPVSHISEKCHPFGILVCITKVPSVSNFFSILGHVCVKFSQFKRITTLFRHACSHFEKILMCYNCYIFQVHSAHSKLTFWVWGPTDSLLPSSQKS